MFAFGGYLALMPSLTADYYGPKHVGANYGLVFTAWGICGFLVPGYFARSWTAPRGRQRRRGLRRGVPDSGRHGGRLCAGDVVPATAKASRNAQAEACATVLRLPALALDLLAHLLLALSEFGREDLGREVRRFEDLADFDLALAVVMRRRGSAGPIRSPLPSTSPESARSRRSGPSNR